MELSANAMITVDEYKIARNIDPDDENVNDDQIILFINGVSADIESYCNRKFVTPSSAIDEDFVGDGEHNYFVKNRSITATPTMKYWDGSAYVTIDTNVTPFAYRGETGEIYFTRNDNFFSPNDPLFKNWRVSYLYGWAREAVPFDLKLSAIEMVGRGILRLKKAGLKSDAIGGGTNQYNTEIFPDFIKIFLDKYKVLSIG